MQTGDLEKSESLLLLLRNKNGFYYEQYIGTEDIENDNCDYILGGN